MYTCYSLFIQTQLNDPFRLKRDNWIVTRNQYYFSIPKMLRKTPTKALHIGSWPSKTQGLNLLIHQINFDGDIKPLTNSDPYKTLKDHFAIEHSSVDFNHVSATFLEAQIIKQAR